MNSIDKLFLENKAWANERRKDDPSYFKRLSEIQTPEFLWIGCSDSGVPVNEITGTDPGEIFVHRNIANMVVHTDLNLLSVLEYAVHHLKVQHIIVCGHYGCGGVKAAVTQHNFDILNKWLRNIKDVKRLHQSEIGQLPTEIQQLNRLIELNVEEQVINLAKTSIVQKAWKYHHRPTLHGWVYNLEDGLLKKINEIQPNQFFDELYCYDNLYNCF